MTDNEIIKALECCCTDVRENTCPKCAFYKKHRCSALMLNAVSDLLNRRKARTKELEERISYLEESIDCSRKEYNRSLQKMQQLKSEAIKEFAEQLKKEALIDSGFEVLQVGTIDNLVKEVAE